MKKLKLKRKIIKKLSLLIVILIMALIFISPYLFIRINLIGDDNIIVNYGDKYSEPGYKASIFGKNVTEKIKLNSNLNDKIGKYQITYTYKFLFYKINKIRYVNIQDVEPPRIELNDGDIYELTINEEYSEPGYTAFDNKDNDVTLNVKVTGEIDNSTLGEYKLSYEVSDTSGNKASKERKIKVVRKSPIQMSLTEYNFNGWYEDTNLKLTKNYGNDYFNEITMVGDSNTMNMYKKGYLSGKRAWAIPCLHANMMHVNEINLYGLGIKMKLIDAVAKYKPKTLILNFGTFSTTWISQDVFIEKANSIIEKIKENSEETNIILISIYPITKNGPNINKFSQSTINKYNFMILEMANKHNIKYLDVQTVLKDKEGYGNTKYYLDDGYHVNRTGHSLVKEYIKTHGIEE